MVFFYPNQAVVTVDGPGRVVCHDYTTRDVHVMLKTGDNSWQVKKYHQLYVQEHEGLLWPANRPYNSNHISYVQYYRY